MLYTWKKICGFDVKVDEEGFITYGVRDGRTVYVYRVNRRLGGYDREDKISVAAFRAGVRRGSIWMY